MKSIDKAIHGMVSKSAGRNETERLAWIIHDFAGGKRKGALKD
jgi:hypothetical protein